MLADFLEPFWKALFEKTGVFGLFIASFAPIILIVLALLIIAVVLGIFMAIREKILERMYNKALYLEYRCRYDEAWKLFKKYAKRAKPSAEVFYHIGMFCDSAKKNGWEYCKGDARPSYWFERAGAMGYKAAECENLKIRFYKNFPSNLLESAKIFKEIDELFRKNIPEAKDALDEVVQAIDKKKEAGVISDIEKGAVLGRSYSQMVLSENLIKQKKDKESLEWLAFSAESGNTEAMCMMANFYRCGSWDDIIKKNPRKAFEYYKKAAENGSAEAKVALGEMYYLGEGCEKNILEAARSFAKAADEDKNPSAAHNASICYYQYANECVDKKGITDPLDRKLNGKYMTYSIQGTIYADLAEKLGYVEK